MRWQPRWFFPALLPLAVGLAWLGFGWHNNLWVAALATVPGVVLIATGGAQLLWAGDRQINYHMAFAAVISVALAAVSSLCLGWVAATVLVVGGVATFFVAGWAAFVQQPVPPGVPQPQPSVALIRKVATDTALLGFFVNCARIPRGEAADQDRRELQALSEIARERDWRGHPARYHRAPGPPEAVSLCAARAGRQVFEWLTFDSGFLPDPDLPGALRWGGYAGNRRMDARVLRHAGNDRPWLMCIHGYRMGVSAMDFALFEARRLHQELGFNVIMPILPLHGPRRATWLTGGLFLDGPMTDLLHAESQTLWDLRRCLAWIRQSLSDARIGVIGFSLGGYNAALLAAFEPDLACAIAGIPLTDIPASLWHHMPGAHRRSLEALGIRPEQVADLLAPVSPLHLPVQVPIGRRFMFAAIADQLVPAEQPLRLWEHWGRPPIHWYNGSHLSVRHEAGVRPFIDRALRETGLLDASG